MTGCQSELKNETFFIHIIDIDGNILVNESMTSYSNGFIGIWLPYEIEATMTITYKDKSSVRDISTFKSSDTCITTMKLQ